MTRWAIVGSRGFSDRQMFDDVLSVRVGPKDTIVSGGARGPDTWAEEWAKDHDVRCEVHRADWSQGRGAGFARNGTIVANADIVLAFWDGQSRGTADTIRKAEAAGKPIHIFTSPLESRRPSPGGER